MLILPLTPNPRPPRAYEFIGFDTEGDGSEGGFKLAAAYDDDGAHVFYTQTQARSYLFRRANRGKRIVCCNLEYDYAVAFQPFDEHFNVAFTGERWLSAIYRDGSAHSWVAWDLQRIAPLSVAEMGDLIGLPKLETPQELLASTRGFCGSTETLTNQIIVSIEEYCTRDAEIAYRFALFFQRVLNRLGGEMKPTAAACAMDLFRRRYLKQEVAPTMPDNNAHARRAYYGGRVETLHLGTARDVNCYDINSLYPSVYRDLEVGDPATYHRIATPRDPMRYLDKFGQFTGEIAVPKSYLGALPTHVKTRLVFPTSTLKGSWTLSEVRHALEQGCRIVACDSILYADRTMRLFREFVDRLYSLRRQWLDEHRPDEYVVKVMLNGLYGKFGQRVDGGLRTLVIPPSDHDLTEFEDCEPVEVMGWQGFLKESLRDVQSPHIHVLWSAEIAAAARVKLYDTLARVGGKLFYCDTDSIHTDAKLKTSRDLGGLKLQERFDQATYYAPKEYRAVTREGDEITAVKGVPTWLHAAYLSGEAVEFESPTHTLTAIATRSRIATWQTRVLQKRASPDTRYHRPISNYLRSLVDTRPFSLDEALVALSDS